MAELPVSETRAMLTSRAVLSQREAQRHRPGIPREVGLGGGQRARAVGETGRRELQAPLLLAVVSAERDATVPDDDCGV